MKGKFVFCFGVCVSPRFSPQFSPLGCLVWPISDRRTNTSLHIDSPITFGSEPRWLSAFSFSVLIIFILKNHFIMQGYLTVKSLYNLLSVYANGEQKLLRLHRKEKNSRTEIDVFLWLFFSPSVQLYWWQIDPKVSKPKLKERFVGRISNPSSISHVCLQILIKPPTVKTWKWRQNLNSQLDLLELSLFSVIYKFKKNPKTPTQKKKKNTNKSSKQQLYTIFFYTFGSLRCHREPKFHQI